MKASYYDALKKRLAAWRRELKAEKSKYSKQLIQSTIAALKQEIVESLKARDP